MEQTSRLRVLDAVELIANQIAIGSHCQELINEYMADYDLEPTEDLRIKLLHQQNLLWQSISLRRMIMDNLLQSFEESDKNFRCSFKHAVASYMFATECAHISCQNIWWEVIQQRAYYQMIQVLSLFLGIEPQLCWRCLQDILHDKLNKDVLKLLKEEGSADGEATSAESSSIPAKKVYTKTKRKWGSRANKRNK